MSKENKSETKPNAGGKKRSHPAPDSAAIYREGFESIIVAILLALLFRGFEAEAFIIPTGSMAPTLQGKHKDLQCPECNYRYRVNQPDQVAVPGATCPMCRYETEFDDIEQPSYNGDRIIVNKFAYEVNDPERWDVIVFKFPGNAKQNYIKRLVGLPGETIRILGGDVYAKKDGTDDFEILRKPLAKIPHILQLVHDTRYSPENLIKAKWPARWHVPMNTTSASAWETSDDRQTYELKSHDEVAWLRYRHLPPVNSRTQRSATGGARIDEWSQIRQGGKPQPQVPGRLIRDWYAYNNGAQSRVFGWHWVGDLAMEVTLDIESAQGELWLDLVEGGQNFRCHIDVATGTATVALPDGTNLTAQTPLQGNGSHRVMWSNLDDQVALWVDGEAVSWSADGKDHKGTYASRGLVNPKWTEDDPGDLHPVGIGGRNVGVTATKLKVFRDVYYIAQNDDFSSSRCFGDYKREVSSGEIVRNLVFPPSNSSESEAFFNSRNRSSMVEFKLGPDQFFPMGDNSPQSKDARLWRNNVSRINDSGQKVVDNYVERDLLIGKAIIVYWPHGWPLGPLKLPINPIPDVDRMGKIR